MPKIDQADRANDYRAAGYSVGTTDGGTWLTIPGSALYRTPLFLTEAEARQHAADRGWSNIIGFDERAVCVWVIRTGSYFMISK